MDSLRRATIIVTILLSIFLHNPSSTNATRLPAHILPFKLVNEFCNKAQDKTFCFENFKLDPRSESAQNNVELAKIAVQLGLANATQLRENISEMLRMPSTNPDFKPILEGCGNMLNHSVGFLTTALKFVDVQPYDSADVDYAIMNAGDYISNCGKELDSCKVHDASISNKVKTTSSVVVIAYKLTSLLSSDS